VVSIPEWVTVCGQVNWFLFVNSPASELKAKFKVRVMELMVRVVLRVIVSVNVNDNNSSADKYQQTISAPYVTNT